MIGKLFSTKRNPQLEGDKKIQKLLQSELKNMKKAAHTILDKIERKIEILEAIETSVDEKLATFERLMSLSESTPTHSRNMNRYHEVYSLVHRGMKVDEISSVLNMPKGEVELMLNLRKHRRQQNISP